MAALAVPVNSSLVGVLSKVLTWAQQCKVLRPIVLLVVVLVMDVHPVRYGADLPGVDVPVKEATVLVLVVAVFSPDPCDAVGVE